MRLGRMEIQNFRSIERLDLALSNICALVGPNNAGKSNILLALQRVLGRDWVTVSTFDESDVFGHDPDRDVTIAVRVGRRRQSCVSRGAAFRCIS